MNVNSCAILDLRLHVHVQVTIDFGEGSLR